MSTSSVYRARASALRTEATCHTGIVRARFLARADSCDRMAGSIERLTASEPERITTLRLRAGQPVLGEV